MQTPRRSRAGLDRLVIAALGIIWILDGLEETMVGNVAAVLAGSIA